MHNLDELFVYEDFTDFSGPEALVDKKLIRPDGLERAISFDPECEGVTVEQLRDACRRYSARKTTIPGSYAYEHYMATGHAFGFGCCLGTET